MVGRQTTEARVLGQVPEANGAAFVRDRAQESNRAGAVADSCRLFFRKTAEDPRVKPAIRVGADTNGSELGVGYDTRLVNDGLEHGANAKLFGDSQRRLADRLDLGPQAALPVKRLRVRETDRENVRDGVE